ncbi:IS3 family transposase [Chitinophaga sp. Mgbs1]|uniref:IS3 family transposase n=1 Tax=Chitinophaga solisilvae TaxID=1233460 RepID=A0A3S1AWE3_9BACT|nr:IS3 family transposase [Chitinophaga solisilvae]NSL85982.1 IS3 family transposase [Chitinophaga solisilvae]
MKKTRFTETQIVSILKQQENGLATKDICREHGISEATFYNWKSKYGGMEASDVKRLKDLEEENSRLKRLYADLSLDNQILKDLFHKKRLGPSTKRQVAEELVADQGISVSRACRIVSFPRSKFYYRSRRNDQVLIDTLQNLAFKHTSYGFRKLFAYLRRAGHHWNHKRVYRVYRLLKLNKRKRLKRRVPARIKQPLQQQTNVNIIWSMDFMSDSLIGNKRFRTFNVIDDGSREVLGIEVDTSLSSYRIVRVLERIIESRGKPVAIRTDNGPEFTSGYFEQWCHQHDIRLQYIQPGRPMQNGYVERFNRLYREAVLDAYIFEDLYQVRELTYEWMEEYNQRRPHESLKNMTPCEWKTELQKSRNSK